MSDEKLKEVIVPMQGGPDIVCNSQEEADYFRQICENNARLLGIGTMTTKPPHEQAAEEFAHKEVDAFIRDGQSDVAMDLVDFKDTIYEYFLAGRSYFIEHELRGLLEMAREGSAAFEGRLYASDFKYSIDELIAKAREDR